MKLIVLGGKIVSDAVPEQAAEPEPVKALTDKKGGKKNGTEK